MHFTGFPSRTEGLNFDFISPYFIIAEKLISGGLITAAFWKVSKDVNSTVVQNAPVLAV